MPYWKTPFCSASPWDFSVLYRFRSYARSPCPGTLVASSLSHPSLCLFLTLPAHPDPRPPSSLCSLFLPPPHPLPLSVAKALGVTTVTAQAMKVFQEQPVFSEVVSDQEAVAALEKFVGKCQVLLRGPVSVPSLELPINEKGIQGNGKNRKTKGTNEKV